MPRKSKSEAAPEVPAFDPVAAEREYLKGEQSALLELRAELVRRGIDTVGKLDVILGQVNQRLVTLG